MTTTLAPPIAFEEPDVPVRTQDRRWLALAVIAVAQLMVVLDSSIVTIALPKAQSALHITDANRQWVQTAYALSFGGLLLLGGRVADYYGRKRTFIIGLAGFALASGLGGAAPNAGFLFGARALQGAMAALLAPAALSLITVTFTEPKERAKAFGVYGGISGGGAAIGLIAGGLLTQYVSWRWCLYVNIPIALITAFFAISLVKESKAASNRTFDIPGAVLVTSGLVSLVYAFTEASTKSWGAPLTVSLFVVALALLAAFVTVETRSANPLLPLRIILDRNRGGSFLAFFFTGVALFAMFLLMTFYFQGTLGYSALKSGFAFLPFSAVIIIGAGVASKLLPTVGPRILATGGAVSAALGMLWVTTISVHSSFVVHILPGEILMAGGMALLFVSLSSTSLIGVAEHDAGVASALSNAMQQVGGALGVALLNTIATGSTKIYIKDHPGKTAQGIVHGYTTAFMIGAVLLGLAAVAVWSLVRATKDDLPSDGVLIGA